MMGQSDNQPQLYHTVRIEQLVPENHPFRRIRPLIDAERIRELCKPFYCENNGRPSVPPEQLFLAMVGGYLLGARSDRKLVMELQCNMAFRWFVGLDIDSAVWDDTTFSKARTQRFDETDVMEQLFDDTVKTAMKKGWVSLHWSVDGTLVKANASHKSFQPIEVLQKPEDYRKAMKSQKKEENESSRDDDNDHGNPTVDWKGQKRSNATHRSTTDPDSRLATKSSRETVSPGYTVNGVMDNRSRILLGIGVEIFRGPTSEREGALALLKRARDKIYTGPKTLGADKGYFEKEFIKALFRRRIAPHIAPLEKGTSKVYKRVRQRVRGAAFRMSQRARKKIEELWGEAKEQHHFRQFLRRIIHRVRQETLLMGWTLNLKRLATLSAYA
jgi:transposase